MVEYEGSTLLQHGLPGLSRQKHFHHKIYHCKCGTWCEFHYIATTGFRVMEKVQNRSQSTVSREHPFAL